MATKRPRVARTRWLAALWRNFHLARRVGQGMQVIALLALCLAAAQGGLTSSAYARPMSCPTSPSPGVGNCQGTALSLVPGRFSPPSGGPLIWGGTWTACEPISQFAADAQRSGQMGLYGQITRLYRNEDIRHGGVWAGNWDVEFQSTAGGLSMIQTASPHIAPPYDITDSSTWPYDTGNWTPCPPPTPPCTTCLPQLGSLFAFNFSVYAPIASIAGTASCPASSPQGSWCPPSVGNPVTLSVTGFTSSLGPQGFTQCLGEVDGFRQVCLSLSWNLAQQVGPLSWDFDDEQVDPTTGHGTRTPTVTSTVNQPVAHTFEYSSAFDPIRQCARPCSGDLKGPPMPGYPTGTPAFQVSISSNWYLFYTTRVTDFEGQTTTRTTRVDLRRFGSPNPWFTAVTTLPLYVVSYGSVTP